MNLLATFSRLLRGKTPFLRMAVSVALGLFSASQLLAEPGDSDKPVVGHAGDLDSVIVEGAATFGPEGIRDALYRDPDVLVASHLIAPRDEFLALLKRKLTEGYHYTGFPDAAVKVDFARDGNQITISIHEGPRYRCGAVNVSGVGRAIKDAIVARLTQATAAELEKPAKTGAEPSTGPGQSPSGIKVSASMTPVYPENALAPGTEQSDGKPPWMPGANASFGESASNQLQTATLSLLAEHGFFFPKISVRPVFHQDAKVADIELRVLELGPQGTISRIDVEGNNRNSRDEILKFVHLKTGMKVTRALLVAANQQLRNSARFLSYNINPQPPEPGESSNGVRVLIKVKEYARAPLLKEKFSPEEEAALKVWRWLGDFATRSDDLLVEAHSASTNDIRPRLIQAAFSSHDGAFMHYREGSGTAETSLDYSLLFTKGLAAVYSTHTREKLEIAMPDMTTFVTMTAMPAAPDSTNEWTFAVGGGLKPIGDEWERRVTPPFRLQVDFPPAAALHFARDPKKSCRFDGNSVLLSNEVLYCRADRKTGRVSELQITKDGTLVRCSFEPGSAARLIRETQAANEALSNRYSSNHPTSSLIGFGLSELARFRLLESPGTNVSSGDKALAVKAMSRFLDSDVLAPLQRVPTNGNHEAFLIPPAGPANPAESINALVAMGMSVWFGSCRDVFPKYSWPWTVGREAICVVAGRNNWTDSELKRLYESDDTGPIGCLTIASLLQKLQSPVAKTFAQLGLVRLSRPDFRSDCKLLLEGDSGLAKTFVEVVKVLREMPADELRARIRQRLEAMAYAK